MALEIKTSRRRMEMDKNKSKKKAVDFESGSRCGLRRKRKKIKMISRLIRMRRLNGAESFNPKRNHSIEIKEAGRIQPAMARDKYSVEVS